jgi:hypothetical protein
VIDVLGDVTVGVDDPVGQPHPDQPLHFGCHACFFGDFADGGVMGFLTRVDNPGHRRPRPGVGATHQQHLGAPVALAKHHRAAPGQKQWMVADEPAQFDDEFGDRHPVTLRRGGAVG